MAKLAYSLAGKVLEGWKVERIVPKSPVATGGYFSVGYIVSKGGHEAFLKAIDLRKAMTVFGGDVVTRLKSTLEVFDFERTICTRCSDNHMDRVVRAVDSGIYQDDPDDELSIVPYLIFEKADGDIRVYLDNLPEFDLAWTLRTLHHIAVGLQQLHNGGISHNDLKPSNVLRFKNEGSKIADLGRSTCLELKSPHDEAPFAGDKDYAPPELLLSPGSITDWNTKRKGCDLYHFGSMIVFMFARVAITPMLIERMAPEHRTEYATYDEVQPLVRTAFNDAILAFAAEVPEAVRDPLSRMVRELCDPDPKKRGHREEQSDNVQGYSLQRYISEMNLLAYRAEHRLLGRK